ncbi:MAG: hypothetical protein HRT87_00590 [Legionellales bacterium]|nr:hypothetical protein [Legionellales bacterium]
MKQKYFLILATLFFLQIAHSNQSVLIRNNSSNQVTVSLEAEESDISGDKTLNKLYEQVVIGPNDSGVLKLLKSRLAGWDVNISDVEYSKLYDAKANVDNEKILSNWWRTSKMPNKIPQEISVISSMYTSGIDSANKLSVLEDEKSKNRVGVIYQALRLIGEGRIDEISQVTDARNIKMKDFSVFVKNDEIGKFLIDDNGAGLVIQAISSESSGKAISIAEIKDTLNYKNTKLDPSHHGLTCQIL